MAGEVPAYILALPCWQGPVTAEPLKGGLSNESWKVTDAQGAHVARFGQEIVGPRGRVGQRHLAVARPVRDRLHEEPLAPQANGSLDELDPWQGFNRRMHRFNMGVDRVVLKPAATGYQKVTPPVLRGGVRNFFSNLNRCAIGLTQQNRL
jgi:hypothetical protein